jgi:hypothetical protein
VTEEDFNLIFQAALILQPYLLTSYKSTEDSYKTEAGKLYLPAAVTLVNKVFEFKSDASIDAESYDAFITSRHSPSLRSNVSQRRYLPDTLVLDDDMTLMISNSNPGPLSAPVDPVYPNYVELSQMTRHEGNCKGVEIVTRIMNYPPDKKEQWTKDVFAAITLLQNMQTLVPHTSCGLHISLTCHQPRDISDGLKKGFAGAKFIGEVHKQFGKTNQMMESLFGRKPTEYCSMTSSRGAFNFIPNSKRLEFRSPSSRTSGLTLFQTLLLTQDIIEFCESSSANRVYDEDDFSISTVERIEKFLGLDKPSLDSCESDTLTAYLKKLRGDSRKVTLSEARSIVNKLCQKHGIDYKELLKRAAYELVNV